MPKVVTEFDVELAKWKAKTEQVKADMKRLQSDARGARIGESLFGGMKGALAAAGVTVSVAAVKALFDQVDDLADMSAKLNEAPEVLQKVGMAAQISGSSMEGLVNAMLKLERGLGDVENSKAREALDRYGFTAQQILNLPLDEKIIALAEAFQRARQDGSGLADMQAMLGRSSAELIPLMAAGGDELREIFGSAKVLGNEAVFEMARLNDEFDIFTANATTGLKQVTMDFVDFLKAANAGAKVALGIDPAAMQKLRDDEAARSAATQDKLDGMKKMREAAAAGAGEIQRQAEADKAAEKMEKEMKEQESRGKSIDALKREIEAGRISMLPPDEKIKAMGQQLKTMLRDVNPFDPTLAGLDFMLKSAAAGSDEELRLLQKKKEAQQAMAEIDSLAAAKKKTEQAQTARTPGEIGGAINTLLGRSANELILDSSKRQETLLERMADRLREIREEIRRDTIGEDSAWRDDVFVF